METATDYTNHMTPTHFRWKKMSKFNNHPKWKKYLSNVHKMKGAHLQWVNNHYAKFENKEMEAVGVTDYTNQTPSKHFTGKILSSRPQKRKKNHEMCTK